MSEEKTPAQIELERLFPDGVEVGIYGNPDEPVYWVYSPGQYDELREAIIAEIGVTPWDNREGPKGGETLTRMALPRKDIDTGEMLEKLECLEREHFEFLQVVTEKEVRKRRRAHEKVDTKPKQKSPPVSKERAIAVLKKITGVEWKQSENGRWYTTIGAFPDEKSAVNAQRALRHEIFDELHRELPSRPRLRPKKPFVLTVHITESNIGFIEECDIREHFSVSLDFGPDSETMRMQ